MPSGSRPVARPAPARPGVLARSAPPRPARWHRRGWLAVPVLIGLIRLSRIGPAPPRLALRGPVIGRGPIGRLTRRVAAGPRHRVRAAAVADRRHVRVPLATGQAAAGLRLIEIVV